MVKKINLDEKIVIDHYKKLRSGIKTAKLFNCHKCVIYRILNENNIKRIGIGRNLPKEKVIKLYEKCRSADEIARKYKCDGGTILRLLRRNNVEIKPRMYTEEGIKKMKKTFIKMGRGWTNKQIKFLRNNYKIMSNKDLAKVIKKSCYSITARANLLGLYKPKGFHSKMISGENNPMYKKEVTIDTRNKMSKNHKDVSGDKNPNWRNGKSKEPYDMGWSVKFRKSVRKRDNQCCMLCGIHREKLNRAFDVHHINGDKKLSITQNCITLCRGCHRIVEGREEIKINYWKPFMQKLLSDRYGYEYSENQEVILEVGEMIDELNTNLKGGK